MELKDCGIPCLPGHLQNQPPQCSASQHPLTSSHCLQGSQQVIFPAALEPLQGQGVWGRTAGQLSTHLCCACLARAQVCSKPLTQIDRLCPASKNESVMGMMLAAQPASHTAAPNPRDSPDHLSPSPQHCGSQNHSQECSHFSWVPEGAHSLQQASKKRKKIKTWLPRHDPMEAFLPTALHVLLWSTWGPSSSSALWLGYRSCTRRMRTSRSAGRMELALRLQGRKGKGQLGKQAVPLGGWQSQGWSHLE